jgi:hypothetical protein
MVGKSAPSLSRLISQSLRIKENGQEHYVVGYNPDTDSEVESLIYQDAEVSTTTKCIFDSGPYTHRMPDAVLFQDIWVIRK